MSQQNVFLIIIIGTLIIRLQCHIIIRGLSAPDFLALTYNKVSGYSLPQSGSPTHLGTRLVLPVCTQGNTIIDIVTKQKDLNPIQQTGVLLTPINI